MLNKNEINSPCQFAEQAVLYLYGESKPNEQIKFESHLPNCLQCTEELNNFGFVRAEIDNWKTASFSKLETPAINFLPVESSGIYANETTSNDSGSWFADFKKLFYFKPAIAAFAALLICLGITFYLLNFTVENEIVAVNDTNSVQSNVAPTVETPEKPEEIKTRTVKNLETKSSVAAVDVSPQSKPEKQISTGKSFIRTSVNAPKNLVDNNVRAVKETNFEVKKSSIVKKQTIPNVQDIEDEEDESIRLADLFDELDTK